MPSGIKLEFQTIPILCNLFIFNTNLPALLCLRHSVAQYKGPVRPGMDLPCLRYCPRPGRKRRKEHLAGRSAPVGVADTYGRAGHARTYTLGDTV